MSAAAQLSPAQEQVFEKPQLERSVPAHSINQSINKSTALEPEPEKYVQLHITEEGEQTTKLQAVGSEASSKRKSDQVSAAGSEASSRRKSD